MAKDDVVNIEISNVGPAADFESFNVPPLSALETRVLALALKGMEGGAGPAVLGDFVQEEGWFDARVVRLVQERERVERMTRMLGVGGEVVDAWRRIAATPDVCDESAIRRLSKWQLRRVRQRFTSFAAAPTAEWARAVASVLLFGRWSSSPWPIRRLSLYRDAFVYLDGHLLSAATADAAPSVVTHATGEQRGNADVLTLTAKHRGPWRNR